VLELWLSSYSLYGIHAQEARKNLLGLFFLLHRGSQFGQVLGGKWWLADNARSFDSLTLLQSPWSGCVLVISLIFRGMMFGRMWKREPVKETVWCDMDRCRK